MIDRIAIDKLCLSDAKPEGFVPKPSPSLKRRIEAHGVVDPIIVRPLGNTERFEILSNPEEDLQRAREEVKKRAEKPNVAADVVLEKRSEKEAEEPVIEHILLEKK